MSDKIAIVTDSTCDIEDSLLKYYDIHVLPLRVIYKDREYLDNVDITAEEVYNRLEEEVPTTSLPSMSEVFSLFNKLKDEGFTHIVSIHISSGLSGTYSMIKNVAEQVKGIVIEVIDSNALSMGLGFPVLETAKAIKNTLTFDKVVERAKEAVKNTKVFFVVATLEYLIRGGRIGHVSGVIGEFLNIKPIISVGEDGKYYTVAKARGRNQSISKLFEIIKEVMSKEGGIYDVAVHHGGAEAESVSLMEKFRQLQNVNKISTGQISPVMGVHTGSGLLGIVILKVT